MLVRVTSVSSKAVENFRGTDQQVLAQLLQRFAWASRPAVPGQPYDPGSLRAVLGRLQGTQDLIVEVSDG